MPGRASLKKSRTRWSVVWSMHARGVSVHETARRLDVTRGTVQYYLRKGPPEGLFPFGEPTRGITKPTVVGPLVSPVKEAEIVPFRRAQ